MRYLNLQKYRYLYRYVCEDCERFTEIRNVSKIKKSEEPVCPCGGVPELRSYVGPVDEAMYE